MPASVMYLCVVIHNRYTALGDGFLSEENLVDGKIKKKRFTVGTTYYFILHVNMH